VAQNYVRALRESTGTGESRKRPRLLLAGDMVSGGKQEPRDCQGIASLLHSARLCLSNVFCVEHGRWSSGSQFNQAKTIVHPSVREQAAVKQKQRDVWAAVTGGSAGPAAGNRSRAGGE